MQAGRHLAEEAARLKSIAVGALTRPGVLLTDGGAALREIDLSGFRQGAAPRLSPEGLDKTASAPNSTFSKRRSLP